MKEMVRMKRQVYVVFKHSVLEGIQVEGVFFNFYEANRKAQDINGVCRETVIDEEKDNKKPWPYLLEQ